MRRMHRRYMKQGPLCISQALLASCPSAVYEEFLKPLLLVALFAPPEELSAGVVLGAFYFYTLAHQSDFDVCWCKVRDFEALIGPPSPATSPAVAIYCTRSWAAELPRAVVSNSRVCAQGSVSERIFEPLIEQIKGNGGKIRGGQLVSRVEVDASGAASSVVARDRDGQETVYEADAVIFSVGVTGDLLLRALR